MPDVRISPSAARRLDEILVHTRTTWGAAQAERYIRGLFACFEDIAARRVVWRAIPAEVGVEGFYTRYERHYVYWRVLSGNGIGIMTVLHERMHQLNQFQNDSTD